MAEMIHPTGKRGRGNRGECEKLETGDMTAVMRITKVALERNFGKTGYLRKYPKDREGFELFCSRTIEFFDEVNAINKDETIEKKLIPDVECWCMWLGISRNTLKLFHDRGGEWEETIDRFKDAIQAVKKQMAMQYKIPPMVYVFDAVNNHGYVNSNEFHLVKEEKKTIEIKSVAELPQLKLDADDGNIIDVEPCEIKEADGENTDN